MAKSTNEIKTQKSQSTTKHKQQESQNMTRKKAFGNANKKKQLQAKREKKRAKNSEEWNWDEPESGGHKNRKQQQQKLQQQQQASGAENLIKDGSSSHIVSTVTNSASKLRTFFEKESQEVIDERIRQSRLPLKRTLVHTANLVDDDDDNDDNDKSVEQQQEQQEQEQEQRQREHVKNIIGHVEFKTLDMPVRPEWNRGMDTKELERREEVYFAKYLNRIYEQFPRSRLNHFEHNLNVWRQLWRVIELSDICLLVADIRHPLFHFPQSLYRYVTEYHKKPLVFVLNKCDLVGEEQTQKWIDYFAKYYPLLRVVAFSTYTSAVHDEKEKKTRRRKKQVDYNLVHKIWSVCKDIEIPNKPNAASYWKELIDQANEKLKETTGHGISDDEDDSDEEERDYHGAEEDSDNVQSDHEAEEEEEEEESTTKGKKKGGSRRKVKSGAHELITKRNEREHIDKLRRTSENVITLGLIGHPNTGKSCLLNGLVGKTVVSASYTPGHTKHFQTYFVGKHIRLCDSPGLVFPAIDMSRALQVLCGIFPIAQVREPYSAIQYLAERVPIEQVYKLQLPREEGFEEWSAWSICVAYALKRGYVTTRMARPDVYRAANEILRETLYGYPVLLAFDPPSGKIPESHIDESDMDLIQKQLKKLKIGEGRSENNNNDEEADEDSADHDDDDDDSYEIESDNEQEEDDDEDEEEDEEEEQEKPTNRNPFSALADE